MDDDKIKELFNGFEPKLSSEFQFMTTLRKNMEAVEIVKQYDQVLKRRNKVAVIIAATAGFVMGAALSLLFPVIGEWLCTISVSLPHLMINPVKIDLSIVTWIIMAGASGITALNAYEIAMAKLTPKASHTS